MIQIAPSLLSADFSRLEQEAADVAARIFSIWT